MAKTTNNTQKIDHTAQTIAVYNKIAPQYAERVKHLGPIPERERFMGMVRAKGTILDAGCGSGRDSAIFSEHGFSVTGVDLSEKLLAIAKVAAPKATFVVGDLRHLPFAQSSFEGIWACASLLHLCYTEAEKALIDMYGLLRPGGILFTYVKVGSGEHESVEPSTPGISRMFAFYDVKRLKQSIQQAGFSIIDIYTYDEGTRFPELKGKWWLVCFAKK